MNIQSLGYKPTSLTTKIHLIKWTTCIVSSEILDKAGLCAQGENKCVCVYVCFQVARWMGSPFSAVQSTVCERWESVGRGAALLCDCLIDDQAHEYLYLIKHLFVW